MLQWPPDNYNTVMSHFLCNNSVTTTHEGSSCDVISDVAVYYIGMGVHATYVEFGLNSGRIILLFGRPDPFYTLLLCSI